MVMHIVVDDVEIEITAEPQARVCDLAPGGYWIDGRYLAPDAALELYEGASITTYHVILTPSTAFVLDVVGRLRAGRTYAVPRRRLIVGRAPDCDIVLDDPTVSPRHAMIDEHHNVTDLGSTNGTWIDGDLIGFGATQARIRAQRADTRRPGPFNRPPRAPLADAEPPPTEPDAPPAA